MLDRSRRGEGDHEDDHRSVVEAGLGLQRARYPLGQRNPAQHGEDGRGVRGGDHGPDDQCLPPLQPGEVVRARRGHADAHRDAAQRQRGGGRERRFRLLPLRAESALGQDHDQGPVADDLDEFGVVELDVADAVLAHGDADGQVDEQAGEPAARGDPDRRHGDEQDERADEQELVEVVDSQRPFLSLAHRMDHSAGERARSAREAYTGGAPAHHPMAHESATLCGQLLRYLT